jgi:hypothetical protein
MAVPYNNRNTKARAGAPSQRSSSLTSSRVRTVGSRAGRFARVHSESQGRSTLKTS